MKKHGYLLLIQSLYNFYCSSIFYFLGRRGNFYFIIKMNILFKLVFWKYLWFLNKDKYLTENVLTMLNMKTSDKKNFVSDKNVLVKISFN